MPESLTKVSAVDHQGVNYVEQFYSFRNETYVSKMHLFDLYRNMLVGMQIAKSITHIMIKTELVRDRHRYLLIKGEGDEYSRPLKQY